jgi:hypothetical protein
MGSPIDDKKTDLHSKIKGLLDESKHNTVNFTADNRDGHGVGNTIIKNETVTLDKNIKILTEQSAFNVSEQKPLNFSFNFNMAVGDLKISLLNDNQAVVKTELAFDGSIESQSFTITQKS